MRSSLPQTILLQMDKDEAIKGMNYKQILTHHQENPAAAVDDVMRKMQLTLLKEINKSNGRPRGPEDKTVVAVLEKTNKNLKTPLTLLCKSELPVADKVKILNRATESLLDKKSKPSKQPAIVRMAVGKPTGHGNELGHHTISGKDLDDVANNIAGMVSGTIPLKASPTTKKESHRYIEELKKLAGTRQSMTR